MDNKKASVGLLYTALVETIPQGLVPVRMFLLVGLPGLVLSPVELSVLVFVHVVKEPLPRRSRRIPFGPGCHSSFDDSFWSALLAEAVERIVSLPILHRPTALRNDVAHLDHEQAVAGQPINGELSDQTVGGKLYPARLVLLLIEPFRAVVAGIFRHLAVDRERFGFHLYGRLSEGDLESVLGE